MQARPLQSANDRSRWCTVRALVEQGTYRIDDVRRQSGWDTIDLVRHEGRFYSTKPPLFPTIVAGLYWSVHKTIGWTFASHLEATTRLILLLVNIVPTAAALLLLSNLIGRLSASAWTRIAVTTIACFGTLLSPFLSSLNNHTPAAVCVVFALSPAVRIVVDGRREWWRFAAVGFFAAFAFTNELPAAAFVAALAVVLLLHAPRQTLIWFPAGALVPLAAFFTLNVIVTGELLPFYSAYGTEKYNFVHEGVPSYWMNPRGIDKASDSFPVYLLHCTVGHHGLLSLTPVWLITLAGWALALLPVLRAGRAARLRGSDVLFHATGAALSLIVFAFFMTRTANYNYGGVSVGLRWLLWLTPFWLLGVIPAFDRWGRAWWMAGLSAVLTAVSIFSAWYPLDGPWKQPWTFTLMEEAGWIDYSEPKPKFDPPVRSWIRALPDGSERLDDYWVELAGRDVQGRVSRMKLQDGGPDVVNGRSARIVEVRSEQDGAAESFEKYWIDAEAFRKGEEPAEFLLWPNSEPDPEEREAAIDFWGGLPEPKRYSGGAERYLKFSLRRDAFHCRQAYASAVVREADESAFLHRLDVWFCEEIPYGVIVTDRQVQDRRRRLLSRERKEAVAVGRFLSTADR